MRPITKLSGGKRSSFNSRTRKGCDVSRRENIEADTVSIHAPVKGATIEQAAINRQFQVSIHAPVKGAT